MSDLDEYYNNVFVPAMEQFSERLNEIAEEALEKIGADE